jgi:hypothetical protein
MDGMLDNAYSCETTALVVGTGVTTVGHPVHHRGLPNMEALSVFWHPTMSACGTCEPSSEVQSKLTNVGRKPMKVTVALAIIAAGLLVATSSSAQAPKGSTGECKDGTYTSAESKRGACAGHGGVKDWYSTTAPAKATAAPPASAATKTPAAPMAAAPAAPAAKNSATPMAAAPGGGPGQVWVNTKSKVYHCSGDKYYGKTKEGEYMTESAAKAAGNHADHGKACS